MARAVIDAPAFLVRAGDAATRDRGAMLSTGSEYAVEDRVLSVLCGEWVVGAHAVDYLADFVRFVELK